jgi:hypothetical protein
MVFITKVLDGAAPIELRQREHLALQTVEGLSRLGLGEGFGRDRPASTVRIACWYKGRRWLAATAFRCR